MPCLLCGAEKVYHIQSHLSPRSITAITFGETDNEEIYSITPHTGEVEVYRGRSHPNAIEGEIKLLPNAEKGIFCKKCEDAFGILESICQPPLNQSLQDLYENNFKPFRVKEQLKGFSLFVHSNTMQLFLYSVVWRQCLKNKLDVGNSVLSSNEFDYLQNILLKEIYKDIKDIEKADFSFYPRITIFTSKLQRDRGGWANVSPYNTAPELFFLGQYLILYFKEGNRVDANLFQVLKMPTYVLNPQISIKPNNKTSIVGVVPESLHDNIVMAAVRKCVDIMMTGFVKRFASKKNLSYAVAHTFLHEKTLELQRETQEPYFDCYLKAAKILNSL
jgi:hypothetical protein